MSFKDIAVHHQLLHHTHNKRGWNNRQHVVRRRICHDHLQRKAQQSHVQVFITKGTAR